MIVEQNKLAQQIHSTIWHLLYIIAQMYATKIKKKTDGSMVYDTIYGKFYQSKTYPKRKYRQFPEVYGGWNIIKWYSEDIIGV